MIEDKIKSQIVSSIRNKLLELEKGFAEKVRFLGWRDQNFITFATIDFVHDK